jgi:peptide methionine sulfoxide reductase msrA/msrB
MRMNIVVWAAAALMVLGAGCTRKTDAVAASNKGGDPVVSEKTQYAKPSDAELKKKLTPAQYSCTQEGATEKPFDNAYWNNKEDGIYVDVATGEPLFSSLDKYDSGSGWPSFTQPLEPKRVATKTDKSHGMERTEVLSSSGKSHLGHVFDDGPGPNGLRFCINSAALRFVPVDKLKEEGYGRFLFLFASKKKWETATLAGGCFWGMEDLIRQIPGVIETQVGYTGGKLKQATYEQVKKGDTGHAESVQILFDPSKISYEKILVHFFKMHDPTTINRQGNDVGTQYRSAIFYSTEAQKKAAEALKQRADKSGKWGKPIVTEIVPFGEFWRGEDYHQKYLVKNPGGYTCHFVRKIDFE